MENKVRLSLQVPYSEEQGKYFSFRLQNRMRNEPGVFNAPAKLLILSDIEGNFRSLQRLLVKNGVIDRQRNWIFEDGHLVIVGDLVDRGEQVIECLWLIYSLEEKAIREGGYVHYILGNHEIMNLNGDWRYVHPRYAIPDDSDASITALYGGNDVLWRWLLTKNIIEIIGDILLVHGGISPVIHRFPYSVPEINDIARSYYGYASDQFEDPFLQFVFNSDQSPFWYRGFYRDELAEDELNGILERFSVRSIITGHTIVPSVTAYYSGKVINVNTDHANGRSEALLIRKNNYYRVDMRGKRNKIK